jgi:hypothetical protein
MRSGGWLVYRYFGIFTTFLHDLLSEKHAPFFRLVGAKGALLALVPDVSPARTAVPAESAFPIGNRVESPWLAARTESMVGAKSRFHVFPRERESNATVD